MIFFLAAMQNIDESIYDSVKIDGASTMRRIFSVTIPLCKNTFYVSAMLALIWGFRAFGQVWVTTQGGPNYATEVITSYAYTMGFFAGRAGFASSIAVILFFMAVVLSGVYLYLLRRQEREEPGIVKATVKEF
jgi:raffinose/stachyose/melibiose transport system permease protein